MAVLYGLILVSVFYTLISASLSELASSMPAAGGVYYWSSVLSQKHGRIVGFFTGYLNACAWLLSASSISSMMGNEIVAMHLLRSPGMKWQPWQVFIVFQLVNWICCGIVCLGNRFIPLINRIALLLSMCGLIVTVIILAVMPTKHASSPEVWTNFHNTGRWPDGISFMTGLLNAAFAVGVPDCISHLSEEGTFSRPPQKHSIDSIHSPKPRNQGAPGHHAPDAHSLHHSIHIPNRPILLHPRPRRRLQQRNSSLPNSRNLQTSHRIPRRRNRTNRRPLPRHFPNSNRNLGHRWAYVVEPGQGQCNSIRLLFLRSTSEIQCPCSCNCGCEYHGDVSRVYICWQHNCVPGFDFLVYRAEHVVLPWGYSSACIDGQEEYRSWSFLFGAIRACY